MAARTFRFHPAAEVELTAAADWYEERRRGLGAEFVSTVRRKLQILVEAPERWPLSAGTRRSLLTKFPYAIVYRLLDDDQVVEVVAVPHLKRRPKYWSGR